MEELKNKVGRYKALIVDDSTTFRKLLKETLHERFSSIEIYETGDGEEAPVMMVLLRRRGFSIVEEFTRNCCPLVGRGVMLLTSTLKEV